jgi:hypothetical protein
MAEPSHDAGPLRSCAAQMFNATSHVNVVPVASHVNVVPVAPRKK